MNEFVILFIDFSWYFLSSSEPIKNLSKLLAWNDISPEPEKGSYIISPSFVCIFIMSWITFADFCVGWNLFLPVGVPPLNSGLKYAFSSTFKS